ncbi:MAG: FHA domain-containing protein, partial [Anaerolineales bacterium]
DQTTNPPYRLIPINSTSQQLYPEPITISRPEIIIGSQKGEGKIAIEHPSITPEHTRIKALEDDRYQIVDLGGASGTWVNHQQITGPKSYIIRDGDIIQIGEAAFRFQIIPRIETPLQNEEKSP